MTQAEIIKIIDSRLDLLNTLIAENTDFNLDYTFAYARAELEQLKIIIKYKGETKMNRIYEVTRCPRCGAYACEREFDYDLNCFDIYNQLDEFVASVYPDSMKEMRRCQDLLKEGECPLCDNWEDGLGHTLGHGTN